MSDLKTVTTFDQLILSAVCKVPPSKKPVKPAKGVPTKWRYDDTEMATAKSMPQFRD
jgi:hypothetical protein